MVLCNVKLCQYQVMIMVYLRKPMSNIFFPTLAASYTHYNAISNGSCAYYWLYLKKLEFFLLLSPKILLILYWKYIGYKLKQKNVLAILKSLPSCMFAFSTASTSLIKQNICGSFWRKWVYVFQKFLPSSFPHIRKHFFRHFIS